MSWNATQRGGASAAGVAASHLFTQYDVYSAKFLSFHKNPVNVLCHLATTPLGLIGAVSLLRGSSQSSSISLALVFFYLISLLPTLTAGVYIGTAVICMVIVAATRYLNLSTTTACICIVLSYALQDLAHMGTGEATMQESYSGENGHIDLVNPLKWAGHFIEQCYYLLPLCVHASYTAYSQYQLPLFRVFEGLWWTAGLPDWLQKIDALKYVLTPLVSLALGGYCIDSKNSWCYFPGSPYFHRVLICNIATDAGESRKKDIGLIRKWVMDHDPSAEKSSHWWYYDLTNGAREAFDRCSNSTQISDMFRSLFSKRHYAVDVIHGMNEVYVTGPNRKLDDTSNSDNVFYTRHVDGPWGFIPFVSVYRCIVGMDKNYMITTHFPLAKVSRNAVEGDVLAFDFNREVHYIESDESKRDVSDDYRVVLKLHYCVYPRFMAPLGYLMHIANVRYNQNFRALFLKTIEPTSIYEHFLAWNVNSWTILYDLVETNIGLRNMVYLLFVSVLWWATERYEVFFVLTSFVHYFRYISTFYYRRGIDFGSFKRDVFLFKTLAVAQLFLHYFFPGPNASSLSLHWPSAALIGAGYAVSMKATKALGLDRTYFAAELGLVEPKWITEFPYGYIPHPMITSQICALAGFHLAPNWVDKSSTGASIWPYVVPIHVCLYLAHMMQEHFDLYKTYPTEAKP